jgi:hypothetical protein
MQHPPEQFVFGRFWIDAEAHFTSSLFFSTPFRNNPAKTKSQALTGLTFEGHRFPFVCLVTSQTQEITTHAFIFVQTRFVLRWGVGSGPLIDETLQSA